MSQKIGRNEPCPCGSGKKHKQCCLKKPSAGAGQPSASGGGFRFDPGAYGRPERGYVPALLCKKRVGDAWHPHFLLANPAQPFDEWTQAAELVSHHLDTAFEAKASGGDEAAGRKLDAMGYKSVEDYRLEDFQSIEVAPGFGRSPAPPTPEPDEAASARAAFLAVVEEQIRSGEPEETGLTFERLLGSGHSEDEAKQLIAALVASEVYTMMKERREYDQERYVSRLRRLPELPEELR